MKDPWTKPPRGWVSRVGGGDGWGGGAWWGENGDNCTCTTIKKINKPYHIVNQFHD